MWGTALLPTLLFLRRRPEDHGLSPDGVPPDLRRTVPGPARRDLTTREVSFSRADVLRMPASLIAGFVAEKVPAQYLLSASYGLMAVSVGVFLLADNALLAYTFGFLYGITTGVQITVMQLIWPDYFGRGAIGAIRGMVLPIQMFSNALGPLIAAVSLDATGSYQLIFTISLLLSVGGAVLALAARKPTGVRQGRATT